MGFLAVTLVLGLCIYIYILHRLKQTRCQQHMVQQMGEWTENKLVKKDIFMLFSLRAILTFLCFFKVIGEGNIGGSIHATDVGSSPYPSASQATYTLHHLGPTQEVAIGQHGPIPSSFSSSPYATSWPDHLLFSSNHAHNMPTGHDKVGDGQACTARVPATGADVVKLPY